MPITTMSSLTASQIQGVLQGIGAFAQRLTELNQAPAINQAAIWPLGQPLGSLLELGSTVQNGLLAPLESIASAGTSTVDDFKASLLAAFNDARIKLNAIEDRLEQLADGRSVFWLDLDLAGSIELADYSLDLGAEVLAQQGLNLGELKVDVLAGLTGHVSVGLDLTPGMPWDAAVLLKVEDLSVAARVDQTVENVNVNYGIFDMGPTDIGVSLLAMASLDLQTPAEGYIPLGVLNTADLDDVMRWRMPTADDLPDVSVSIPFELDIGGFEQSGDLLELKLESLDAFDPGAWQIKLPTITTPGGDDFDPSSLQQITTADLVNYINQFERFLENSLGSLEIPLLDAPLSDYIDIGIDFRPVIDQLKDSRQEWTIDGIKNFLQKLGNGLDIPDFELETTISLKWNPLAESLEWTLPWHYVKTFDAPFDLSQLTPSTLPLEVVGGGNAEITVDAAFVITGGIAIRSAAPSDALTTASLLTNLNSGFGLTATGLVDGDDISFDLSVGTPVGVDLDLVTGLGGNASIQDLIEAIASQTGDKVQASLSENRLVLKDMTTGSGTFKVSAPTVNTVYTNADGVETTSTTSTSTSVAPLVLGLWGASARTSSDGHLVITGSALNSINPLDRIYFVDPTLGPIARATVTVDAQVDGGAALGPLALSVVAGEAAGSFTWELDLNDPVGTDGRAYLSEIWDSPWGDTFDPSYDGDLTAVLQLQVTPDELATKWGMDNSLYSATPIATFTNTALKEDFSAEVPFLSLEMSADNWEATLAPSEKLASMFAGDQLAEFDLQDVLEVIEILLRNWEDSPLMQMKLPLSDKTVGDLLDLLDTFRNATQPNWDEMFAQLDTWQQQLDDAVTLARYELTQLENDWYDRWDHLREEFDRIKLDWDGRIPGDEPWQQGFVQRVGAWKSAFNVALEEFDSLKGAASTFVSQGMAAVFDDLSSTLHDIQDDLNAIPMGLGDIERLIEDMFNGKVPGLTVNVDAPTVNWGSFDPTTEQLTAPTVGFDITFDFAGLEFAYDLAQLDLGAGTGMMSLHSQGDIALLLDAQLATSFDIDLSDFSVSDEVFTADVTFGVDASNVVIGASLGGLAEISLGIDADPATISLDSGETLPAPVTLHYDSSATTKLTGQGEFTAHLPVYVLTPAALGGEIDHIGGVDVTANFNVASSNFSAPTVNANFDLSELFNGGVSLGTSGWVDGAIAFVDGLIYVLESDFVGALPFVGEVDLSDSFLYDLRDTLVTLSEYDSIEGIDGALTTFFDDQGIDNAFAFTVIDSSDEEVYLSRDFIDTDDADGLQHEYWVQSFDQVFRAGEGLLGAQGMRLDFHLQAFNTLEVDLLSVDTGLDALGLSFQGDAKLDLLFKLGLHAGFGYSPTDGFELFGNVIGANEIDATFALAFDPDSVVSVGVGPLTFSLTDESNGDITTLTSIEQVDELIAASEVYATLGIDMGGEAGAAIAGDMFGGAITLSGEAKAELDVALTLDQLGLGVVLNTGIYNNDPTHSPIAYSLTAGDPLKIGDSFDPSKFHFGIEDSFVDVFKLLGMDDGGPLDKLLEKVHEAFEPLDPVLSLLTTEIPLLSDLSQQLGNGPVTFADAISWFGEGGATVAQFIDFIEAVDSVVDGLNGNGRLSLGSLTSSATSSAGVTKSSIVAPASSAPPTAVPDAEGNATAPGFLEDLLDPLHSIGIHVPLLEQPATQLAALLFGDDVDLIQWDIPDLNAGFEIRQSFPVFPPLFVTLFGGVTFETNFDLGYDTRGIRLALADGGDAADLLNGVYLVDTGHKAINEDATSDLELALTATIGAGAELNVAVAKAGVEGGLKGVLGADLNDPNNDGKVYLDEFAANLMKGVECVFDYEGALKVFLEAYIKVGLDTPFGFVTLFSDRFKLAEATILDWSLHACPPAEPKLGVKVDTTLTLNMGALAVNVLADGSFTDGDEVFLIDVIRDAEGVEVIGAGAGLTVSAYAFTENFEGITAVEFDAGIGNDTVIFTPDVRVSVKGSGGDGNDNLVGGSGVNELHGNDGSDLLSGRGANDKLYGDAGDDFLYGYGGADSLDGGSGEDVLYGDDETGDMAAFNAENADFAGGLDGNDTLLGGSGDDLLVGGKGNDSLSGNTGDDVLLGGDGNDAMYGDAGNDQLQGGAGNDVLYGDDLNGYVQASSTELQADKLEGGTGFNVIHGGAGDDLIYAADEEQEASAPETGANAQGYASILFGDDGADMMYGTAGNDYVLGGAGSDYIGLGDGDNWAYGGAGSDALIDGSGNSTLLGGTANDVFDGGAGDDRIEGGPGNDQIYAREGEDTVYGGTSNEDIGAGATHLNLVIADGLQDAASGGFRATPSPDSCAPDIYFYPETYPPFLGPVTVEFFYDLDRDGVRDAGESLITGQDWTVQLTNTSTEQSYAERAFSNSNGAVTYQETAMGAGYYEVLAQIGADNPWIPVDGGVLQQRVKLTEANPSAGVQFGLTLEGAIAGRVIQVGSDGKEKPLAGKRVFLDEDGDHQFDAGESYVLTSSQGTYQFNGLAIGNYTVVLDDAALGCVQFVEPGKEPLFFGPGWATVKVDGGLDGTATETANFALRVSDAPVVSSVSIGTASGSDWTAVPDGEAQLDPIYVPNKFPNIKVSLCADGRSAFDSIKADALKITLEQNGTAIPVTVTSVVDTADGGKDIILTLGGDPSGDGEFVLTVSDAGISAGGAALDGEWLNPTIANPYGDRFTSGDGTSGGAFIFQFATTLTQPAPVKTSVSSASTMLMSMVSAVEDPSVVHLGEGDASISGTVWHHNPNQAGAEQGPGEYGVGGQTVRLTDASGQTVATAVTDDQGHYRFEGLAPGDYQVVQDPALPWQEAVRTVSRETNELLLATEKGDADSKLYKLDLVANKATLLATVPIQVQDVAVIGGVAYLSGNNANGTTSGVWSFNLLKPTDPIQPLLEVAGSFGAVALDRLTDTTLVGVDKVGRLSTFDVVHKTWSEAYTLVDDAGKALKAVGDVAVIDGTTAYVVAYTGVQPLADGQLLVQFDPLSGEVYRVDPLQNAKAIFSGLEWTGQQLIATSGLGDVTAIDLTNPDQPTCISGANLTGWTPRGQTGLAYKIETVSTTLTPDTSYTITVDGSDQVEVGFGDAPLIILPDGDDTVDGGCGDQADVIYGDDQIEALPDDFISVGGNDVLRGRGGDDTIDGGLQGDWIRGEEGNDSLTGGSTESNVIDGGLGNDIIVGGDASDRLMGGANVTVDGVTTQDGNDSISGQGGNDWIYGQSGNDTLHGDAGDDVIVGGSGIDQVYGDADGDTLVVMNDTLGAVYAQIPYGGTGALYDGGAGTDQLVAVARTDTEGLTITLTDTSINLDGTGSEQVAGMESAWLEGGSGNDTIDATGFAGDVMAIGHGGYDDLSTGAGNDTLAGGADSNMLDGGSGNDTYLVKTSGSASISDVGGTDLIDASQVAAELRLTLNGTDVVLQTVAGYSTTDIASASGVAIEQVILGATDDTIKVTGSGSVTPYVDGGDGIDTLDYSGLQPWSSSADVDLDAGSATGLSGVESVENIVGSPGNDTLAGSKGDNIISGGGGTDKTKALDGYDTIMLPEPMVPGKVLIDDIKDPVIEYGSGSLIEVAGFDSLATPSSASSMHGYSFVFADGASLDLRIDAAEIDSMYGGGGFSTDAYESLNTLDYSAYTTAVVANLTLGTALGTKGVSGIHAVIGGSYADLIAGSAADDMLKGNGGLDILLAGDGDDYLVGGAKNDVLVGGHGNDTAGYSGKATDYTVNPIIPSTPSEAPGYTVYSKLTFETDKLYQIENLYFEDEDKSYAIEELTTKALPAAQPIASVSITNTATQGVTLSATATLASAAFSLSNVKYQWFADDVAIAGATTKTLTLTQAQVGKIITVEASYALPTTVTPGYTGDPLVYDAVSSEATAAVVNVNDLPTGQVTIRGSAVQGETLTAVTSTLADLDGLGTLSYQWLADGTPISGAIGEKLTLTQDQAGSVITVAVSYQDAMGAKESLTSAPFGQDLRTHWILEKGEAPDLTRVLDLNLSSQSIEKTATGGVYQAQWMLGVDVSVAMPTNVLIALDAQSMIGGWFLANHAAITKLADGVTMVVNTTTGLIELTLAPSKVNLTQPLMTIKAELSAAIAEKLQASIDKEPYILQVDAVLAGEKLTLAHLPDGVLDLNDPMVGQVWIQGDSFAVGAVLEAHQNLEDPDGLQAENIVLEWLRDGVPIGTVAQGDRYTLDPLDVGHLISVRATATDDGGFVDGAVSSQWQVQPGAPVPVLQAVQISGQAINGLTLTAQATLAMTDEPVNLSFNWYANGRLIRTVESKENSDNFVLTSDLVGKSITVSVVYDKPAGGQESFFSAMPLKVQAMLDRLLTVGVHFWNRDTAIDGVQLFEGMLTEEGMASLQTQQSSLVLAPSKTASASDGHAVNLQDAIAILKSIVGLQTLSDPQKIAADFNANDRVELNDAIGVLKHVVGLQTDAPEWVFVNPLATTQEPLTSYEVELLADTDLQLVGILRGDVDGSWVG
jgi:Ca2+-binding RTX toxin-like protein